MTGPGRSLPVRRFRPALLLAGLLLLPAGRPAAVGQTGPAAAPAPLPRPALPRHHPHIRIAMLAYAGNPMGAFEDGLLQSSVDVVVPDVSFLKHIHDVAPKTPQLVYTNTSTLYLDLLTDWLAFADAGGASREAAFYHAAVPHPFKGNSPSSRPVDWFWGVLRGGGRSFTDLTWAAHTPGQRVAFAGVGDSLYLGYPDRFREINVALAAAAQGCRVIPEFCAGVDGSGSPTAWEALPAADGTAQLSRSGRITFDPPRAWRPASIHGSARLYYVRLRTASAGTPAVASSLRGRNFVNGQGTTNGIVPVFDGAADADHDGYLSDAEYARRAPGKDARFLHESRMVTDNYGAMRFATNPAAPAFRRWAALRHKQLLARQPLAAGLFMDNSDGRQARKPGEVVEPLGSYADDYGGLMAELARALAPRWILLNTAGGGLDAEKVIRRNPAYLEEFALRPLGMHWLAFEDLLTKVERRARLTSPPPLAVIDSHPEGGACDDPRTQLATLAAYYLMANPDSTCLMFFGGAETMTTWRRHWTPAAAHDVGRPRGACTRFATGADPSDPGLSYRVYARTYDRALVLYRPRSAAGPSRWGAKGGLGADTAVRHELGATYRPLQADGTLGAPLTGVTLRGGEGAILMRIDP